MTYRNARLYVVLGSLLAGCVLLFCGCQRILAHQPGQAFLDSQIPSDLAPQYYPPDGFVWAGYRTGDLPEARYGVASPPVNPSAEVLVLADADYPAEIYFELARPLLAAGYGVWILEPPGQGGAGRYLLQGNTVHMPDYRDADKVAIGLVSDLIRPSPTRPLYVVGSGYGAITALSLATQLKGPAYAGYFAFDPYLGGEIAGGELWHRDRILPGYWGRIAQSWQVQNPDLRLRMKSATWRKQTMAAFLALAAARRPLATGAPVFVLEPQGLTAPQTHAVRGLCAHITGCQVRIGPDAAHLGSDIMALIKG